MSNWSTMPMPMLMPILAGEEQEAEPMSLTYDEVSMQQSKHFLQNLQELKNIRPQLYNAAEYCELSYLNSDRKQMVMDNLKDYAVKALINTVDHLGCVSYKLNDFLNQQIIETSSTQHRIACLNQRLRKCQEHTDREGLMQQCLVESTPRYHKRYILPRSVIEDSEANVEKLTDSGQDDEQLTPSPVYPEVQVARNANSNTSFRDEFGLMPSAMGPESFFFQDTEVPIPSLSSQNTRVQSAGLAPGLTTSSSFAAGRRQDSSRISKSASMRLLNDDSDRLDICKPPTRSKSLLCFLMSRRKSSKQRVKHF